MSWLIFFLVVGMFGIGFAVGWMVRGDYETK